MAGKRLEYQIGVDPSQGIQGLKQFSGAAKKAMKDVDDSMSDTTTSAQKVAKALSGLADDIESEMKGAAKAAEALSDALGPELAGRANVDSIVADLRKMGLSFDEITADADTLAGSLKKLDGVQLQGIETSAKRTSDSMDKIVDGADKTASATANLVGNAGQDLGELAGISGSAGVALGQLAEGFADAAFAAKESGQGIGAIAKNLVGALGPIAAISAGIAIVTASVQAFTKPAEDAAQRTDNLGEAMKNSADDALGFAQVLRENADVLTDFIANANDPLGGFGVAVDEAASHIPLIGQYFKEAGVNVFDAAKRAGLSVYDLGKQIQGTGKTTADFKKQLQVAVDAGLITEDEMNAIAEAIANYGDSAKQAAKDQGLFNVGQKEANALLQELLDQKDPMRRLARQWTTLMDDLGDGQVDTEQAAAAINELATALGLDPQEVISLALDKITDKTEEANKSLDDTIKGLEDWGDTAAKAFEDYAVSISHADDELVGLGSDFARMATNGDALESVFAMKDAPLDLAGQVRDITLAIDDLSTAAEGVDLSKPLDPTNVKADKLLDALDALRPDIQQKITETFSAGGPEAATKLAEDYITQVQKELGGPKKISREEVAKLLGLDNIEVTIEAAVHLSEIEKAKKQLEILTGVQGETPWSASIALALDAGTITGEQAQMLIQPELNKAGVTIPTSLQQPVTLETLTAAQTALNKGKPLTVPAVLTINEITAIGGGKYRMKNGVIMQDAGGTTPFPGGIVAERGAEIVRFPGQRRDVLVTSPSYVPPGTRVTSRRKTAHILSTRGTRGLRRYDSGGMVAPVAISPTINITTGVIANPFEMMHIVDQASRRIARLLPRHP